MTLDAVSRVVLTRIIREWVEQAFRPALKKLKMGGLQPRGSAFSGLHRMYLSACTQG
jgi:hypothetical protein